jgi:predicted dithiol-disulfide oxidoreductase (DUF899 family)
MDKPEIVSTEQWQAARAELLAAEKELTRALDRQAAARRRLPMVKFTNEYVFDSPSGDKSLLDLFEGRDQLVVYQFMDNGPDHFCPGCTHFTDNVPIDALTRLAEAGVSWATVSNMPLAQIEATRPSAAGRCRSSPRTAPRSRRTAAPTTSCSPRSCGTARRSTGRTAPPRAAWTGCCSRTTSSI